MPKGTGAATRQSRYRSNIMKWDFTPGGMIIQSINISSYQVQDLYEQKVCLFANIMQYNAIAF